MQPLLKVAATLTLLTSLSFSQGSVLLVGGGSENYNDWSDVPYRWLVQHAPNRTILILHYSTASTFLPGYFRWLGATSATNLVISSTAIANDSATLRTILAADGVFLRGGDQWQYIRLWKGTLAEQAIRQVFQRGGVVGGTSAGMAVLTQVIFDARVASVDPRSALRNPLSSGITFTEGFLGFARGIIGDTHFYERGRLGRLLAMIAVYKSQNGTPVTGVGVDYSTALGIDSSGTGEVMGAGTVTVLRLGPGSIATLEPGKPLAESNVLLDQLTAGYRITVPGCEISQPATAEMFAPKVVSMSSAPLVLDGSGRSSTWTGAAGSLNTLLTLRHQPADTIGIFSKPGIPAGAASIASFLDGKGVPYLHLPLSGGTMNDPVVAASCTACGGFVFVSNSEDSLAGFLGSTAVGGAFADRIQGGSPTLMVSNDSKLAADSGVGRTEENDYGAYEGALTLIKGLGLVTGIEFMPRAYEDADSIDNRFSGLFWGMGKSRMAYGVLLDDGTNAVLSDAPGMSISGATPAIIVDARNLTSLDFPSFHAPGLVNPRQNAAMVGALVSVVRGGQAFDFVAGVVVGMSNHRNIAHPDSYLSQNYPNPFNPTTRIEYSIPVGTYGRASLRVYDMLGREVAVLVDGRRAPGSYVAQFNASGLASGVYIFRLETPSFNQTRKTVLLK